MYLQICSYFGVKFILIFFGLKKNCCFFLGIDGFV